MLEKLHSFFPSSQLDVLVRNGNESLFIDHPFINKCLVWNKSKGKYKSLFQLISRIRNENYDAVINLHRFASSGILTAFSNSNLKLGFDKNPFSFLFTKKTMKNLTMADLIEEARGLLQQCCSKCKLERFLH